jgi:type III secretion protein Q
VSAFRLPGEENSLQPINEYLARLYMDRTATSARHLVSSLHDSAIALPSIDPAIARLTRLFCDGRLEERFRQALDIADWHVGHGIGDGGPQNACWIDLQYEGGLASIGLDPAQYPALTAAATSVAHDDASATAPLRCAVAALLLAPLIDALDTLGAPGVGVAALGRRAPDGPTLDVRFTRHAQRFECRLGNVDTAWLDLLERQLRAHRLPFTQRVSGIRVPGYLIVGDKKLRIGTLNRLRSGDVILRALAPSLRGLDGASGPVADLELRWGPPGMHQFVARATLDGKQLVINRDPDMTYRNDRSDLPAMEPDVGTSIDELDLPVRFEIETVTLPLVQLSALRAGYVLELPGTLRDARVRLVSYGQLIGVGELVSVGEQLGVRVIEMFGSHDAD